MRDAILKMFWGFIFVLIEIHIVAIDILPDPVGYYLIYVGITSLLQNHPVGKTAANWAMALTIVSIPSIFIENNGVDVLSWWSLYMYVMGIFKLILVFYVFRLLLDIAKSYGDLGLQNSTTNVFNWYMITNVVIYFVEPFRLNWAQHTFSSFFVVLILVGLIIEIVFLVHLMKYRHLKSSPKEPIEEE